MKYLTWMCFVVVMSGEGFSQHINWMGSTGFWDVPSNWDCNCIPSASDSVMIAGGNVTIPAGFHAVGEMVHVSQDGHLMVNDTLTLANTGAEALLIEGQLTNSGVIRILAALNEGIDLTGTMVNDGEIWLDSVMATGIYMDDEAMLTNEGLIHIIAAENEFGIFLFSGSISNGSLGEIDVRNGFPFTSTIYSNGVITNHGVMKMYRGDVSGTGTLYNYGVFSMDNPLAEPHQGFLWPICINYSSGHLEISNTSSFGITFTDTLINFGYLRVANTFSDAINIPGAWFVNHGDLDIEDSGRYGIVTGINSVFRNESGASLNIRRTVGTGLRIERIELYNDGIIRLDTVGSNTSTATDHGIECIIQGSMFNDTSGQILIDSCYASGLSLATALPSVNHGIIHIRRARQNGVSMSSNHTLSNTGSIDIDTIQGVGVILTGTTTGLTNQGYITVGPAMDLTDFSINNSCIFINDTCGHISTTHKLRNSGTWTNWGFLKNRSTVAHTFTSGGSTVNEGVVEDYNGFFLAHANTENNGVIVNAKSSDGCPAYIFNGVLSLGSNDDFIVPGVYADLTGVPLVAEFDSLVNEAEQLDIFPATGDWLWIFENVHTGCHDTIRMKMTVNCPVICDAGTVNYWTACGLSSDWSVSSNWSAGVPSLFHDVVVPFIPSRPLPVLGLNADIHTLELRPSAELMLTSGNTLSIRQ